MRNLGLLVKVAGKVTYVGGSNEPFFYMDDGCKLSDGSGHTGLRVECRNLPKPGLGFWATVTGVGSCCELNGSTIRTVKARRAEDISSAPIQP